MKLSIQDPLTLEEDHDPIPKDIGLSVEDGKIRGQKVTLYDEQKMIDLLWWLENNTEEFNIYKLDISIEDCICMVYEKS